MARPLAMQLVNWLTAPERLKAEQHPVLIWDAPKAAATEESWEITSSMGGETSSAGDGPLVFDVLKKTGVKNPFTMGITVGRMDTNDVSVNDASLSRFHAFLVEAAPGKWTVSDAESTHGTWLDGRRLAKGERAELKDLARVRFGTVEMQFLLRPSYLKKLKEMESAV
jgi:hypothetical protein